MTKGNGRGEPDANGTNPVRAIRAARVRAARAYAGIEQARIAELFGVSIGTVKRLEAGRRDISIEEMVAIAELCEVPAVFMLQGFDAIQTAPLTYEDGQHLRDEMKAIVVDEFQRRFADLSRALLADHEARQIARDAIAHLAR